MVAGVGHGRAACCDRLRIDDLGARGDHAGRGIASSVGAVTDGRLVPGTGIEPAWPRGRGILSQINGLLTVADCYWYQRLSYCRVSAVAGGLGRRCPASVPRAERPTNEWRRLVVGRVLSSMRDCYRHRWRDPGCALRRPMESVEIPGEARPSSCKGRGCCHPGSLALAGRFNENRRCKILQPASLEHPYLAQGNTNSSAPHSLRGLRP